jgi:hypothetical protein
MHVDSLYAFQVPKHNSHTYAYEPYELIINDDEDGDDDEHSV